MKKSQTERNWFTTIMSSLIALIVTALIFILLPITNWTEGLFFGSGVVIIALCIYVAIDGKKGMVREIIDTLTYWT